MRMNAARTMIGVKVISKISGTLNNKVSFLVARERAPGLVVVARAVGFMRVMTVRRVIRNIIYKTRLAAGDIIISLLRC